MKRKPCAVLAKSAVMDTDMDVLREIKITLSKQLQLHAVLMSHCVSMISFGIVLLALAAACSD